MREMNWYYTIDGRQQGPVDEKELFRLARERVLKPDDFVWNEGMGEQWAGASTVPGLFSQPAVPGVAVSGGSDEKPPPLPSSPSGTYGPAGVSCVRPVGLAWARMVGILFRPFDMGKWFVLGFGAWLATLGQGGGRSFSYQGNFGNFGGQHGAAGGHGAEDFEEIVEGVEGAVREFLQQYGEMTLLIGAGVALLAFVIGLLVLWLRSRGKFMLLDNVVYNRAEIAKPWKVFAQHGNSLFLWNVVYGLICLALSLVLLASIFFGIVAPCYRVRGFDPSTTPIIIFVGILWLVFGIVAWYINRFLEDFIIPAMYKHDLRATEAWGKFLSESRRRIWTFILYGLFYMVLGIAAGACVMVFVLVTCCIGGCLMGIPYLGAVILLPVTVFFRSYSIEYLAQFGPEWDVVSQ